MSNINRTWSLRDAFYASMHQWPSLVAFVVLGGLLGWGLSFIWPPFYRATTEIYVGLNPYRTFSDTNFLALADPKYSNIDNYNYWQMSELEGTTFLEDRVQETLKALQQEDPYWQKVTSEQLREMLSVEWRTAGTWSLIAQNSDPKHAAQAARAWSEVITAHTKDSVAAARNTFMIDEKLISIGDQQLQTNLRQQELSSTRKAILDWSKAANDLPKDESLKPAKRWEILSLVTGLAQFKPSWTALLQDQPAVDALPDDYITWTNQVNRTIDEELPILRQQGTFLEDQYINLAQQYAVESIKSLGLSPNLEVQGIKDLPAKLIRPTGILILIGGFLGLALWVLMQLINITNRAKNQ